MMMLLKKPTTEQLAAETMPVERFFAFAHLRPDLADVSEPFHLVAMHVVATLPRTPERTVALRKILEAKDAAVRGAL